MIINSLLDIDYYKFTMGQLAYLKFPNLKVKYKFNNRTNIKLANFINKDDLIIQIDHVRKLSKSKRPKIEMDYLRTLNFDEDYLNFFETMELPKCTVEVIDGDFNITTEGYWKSSIYWETIILSIINELYYKSKYRDNDNIIGYGTAGIFSKLNILNKRTDILITEFGTRRRFSRDWQKDVVSIMSSNLKESFLGTSNVKLSMELNINPIGTNAHEMYMIAAGIWNKDLRKSHSKILDMWYDMYGFDKSIALTDTFGTNFFFEDFGKERAEKWKGLRHDSGDPIEFGENAIKFYESMDINPNDKILIFSDGLDLNKIIKISDHFKGRIKVMFGWGTKLTNDMGIETLSIVMKVIEVISDGDKKIGNTLVKLSDNLNKSIGTQENINRYKKEFGYTNTDRDVLTV